MIARYWIAPDSKIFFVPDMDTHQDWISSNGRILDKYKVKDKLKTREGLMRAGWIRIRYGGKHKNWDYLEVQFNFNNDNSWFISNNYILQNIQLEVLIANYNGRLLTRNVFEKAKKLLSKETVLKLEIFLTRYKKAIENQIR